MKLHHERLIFRTNRPDGHRRAVFQPPLPHVLYGVRSNGGAGQLLGLHGRIMHHHARVERKQLLRCRQQRIDVDFFNPGLFHHQLAEAQQHPLESNQVHRLASPHAGQRRVDSGLLHQALSQRSVERWQRQGVVAVNFDHDSAGAKQDYGPKLRIDGAANNQFVAIALHHRLHRDSGKMLRSGFFGDGRLNGSIGAANLFLVLQPQANAINIRLVRNGVGQQLQHHRIPDLRCTTCRLFFVFCHARIHHRNSVMRQQLLGFKFIQHGAATRARALYGLTHCPAGVGGHFRSFHQRRSFIKPAQVVGVSPHVSEGARRGIGIRKSRNAGGVENRCAFGHFIAAHPTCQQRFAGSVGERFHALRHLRRIRQSLRRDNGQQAVARPILRRNVDRFHEALRVRIGQHIHRIAMTPVRREEAVQLVQRFCGEDGEFSSRCHERIGRQNSRTSGVSNNGEPRTARPRLLAQHLRHIKKVCDILHAQHAAAAERRF